MSAPDAENEDFLDVYFQAGNALKKLPEDDRYKVVAALCILIGVPIPPRPPPPPTPPISKVQP